MAAPAALYLPLPVNTTIAVAAMTPLSFSTDDFQIVSLTKNLHLEIASGDLAPLPLTSISAAMRADFGPAEPVALKLAPPRFSGAALDWDISRWGSLGLTAVNSTASSDMLGDLTPSALSLTDGSTLSAAGLAAHVKLGDGWVTSFSYNVDITQLDLKAGASPALGTTSVHGQSYGVAVAKHGLFGDADALGISVSRPSPDYFGSLSLADAGLESRVNLSDSYRGIGLANQAQETDVALSYVTTFFKGRLALQANAGYQMNVAGQSGANSLTVLSRAKINF